MSALHLPAPAKLNLVLRIVGRRADGYHLLETLFHALAWHDDLWLRAAAGVGPPVALAVTHEGVRSAAPAGPDNLVVRALGLLRAARPTAPRFEVRLHKRIPAGGGLGGGSSDAAAALRLANALLSTPLTGQELHALGAQLGADVPFFFAGGSQWGRGVGDVLSAAEVPPLHFVLLVPPFDCPTAEVYKNHRLHWIDGRPQDTNSSASVLARGLEPGDGDLRIRFSNDLERAAERVRPALAALRRRVLELAGVSAHLTGSGSTLFVACDDEAAARRCERALLPLVEDGVGVVRTRSSAGPTAPRRTRWPGRSGDPPGGGSG